MANVALLSEPGGLNDPGMLNPQRYSMVDMQYLLESVGIDGARAGALAVAAVAVAAVLTVTLIRGRDPRRELLALSIVAVLTLLVVYHRYYDAVLLALPLAWAFGAVKSGQRAEAVLILLLCGLFILPIPTNLWDMQQAGMLPTWIGESALWEPVILAHEAWALVLMVPILLSAAARGRAADARSPAGGIEMPDHHCGRMGSVTNRDSHVRQSANGHLGEIDDCHRTSPRTSTPSRSSRAQGTVPIRSTARSRP